MIHLGDITKIDWSSVPPVDCVTGGSPCQDLSVAGKRAGLAGERSGLYMEQIRCVKELRKADEKRGRAGQFVRPRYMVWENVCFSGDTLIACETGYKQISEIAIGENVKTHLGRYMPVVKTYKHTNKDVIRLSFMGGEDLIVTPNHPILAREKKYRRNERVFGEPKWVPAGALTKNHMVAHVIDTPVLPDNFISKEEAWALGRWLADGSVDLNKSNPRIFISCGLKKADETRKMITRLPYSVYENHQHKTAINFCFTSREFYSLIKDCGIGAGNKKVPQFVFNLPIELQRAVFEGYASGDGNIRERGKSISFFSSSASRKLSYGIARLVRNVYHVGASVTRRKTKNGLIDGRIIKANYDTYCVNACLTSKVSTCYYENGILWSPVRQVTGAGKTTVYNLSVLEDNTYVSNDIVGHNCGAFSSNKGKDFAAVLEEAVKVIEPEAPAIPVPEGGWPYAGCLTDGVAGRWSLAWRVHDAQFWGVPQRRRRISLVCDFGGQSAPEILFERKGVSWNPQESGAPGEEAAGGTGKSAESASRTAIPINTMVATKTAQETRTTFGVGEDGDAQFTISSTHSHAVCAGFSYGQSAKASSVGYQEERSPTLRSGEGGNQKPCAH